MEHALKKKHIITIAGRPGSGKSTTSKAIAEVLGYEHFSSGDLFRAIGKERGLELYHANVAAEQGQDIDKLVDQRLRDIGASRDEMVIDSRTAWHWIPTSFKVFLDLDLEVAASRIIQNTDPERRAFEHIPDSPPEYAAVLEKRLASEGRRYKKLYNINPYDVKNYDLVIDTGAYSFEEVVGRIVAAYNVWQELGRQ
jgi:cytidylate kinase